MRRNRANIFDRGRNIENNDNEMAEQQIQELQRAIQELREQHQQAINALQQQVLQQPGDEPRMPPMFQLTADQVLNKFQKIRTYYGKEDYPLQEFFSTVENTVVLCGNNVELVQHGLRIVLKEKIQGDAKTCIQRLGDGVTWPQVKTELKSQFKPRTSYRRLFDQVRNVKVGNLRELFNIVRSVNFKLNELYEFDDNRPPNYTPENNDRTLVDILKDMLSGSYRVNVRNNMTLNEVFNVFDELGLLDENDVIHYNFRKNNKNNHNHNNHNPHRKDFKRYENDRHPDPHYNNNNFNTQNNNLNNQSGQFRRPENFRQERNFHNNNRPGQFNNRSGQFNNRQNHLPNNSGQFRQGQNNNQNNEVVPMEIDNLQHQDVNFTDQPQEEDYP